MRTMFFNFCKYLAPIILLTFSLACSPSPSSSTPALTDVTTPPTPIQNIKIHHLQQALINVYEKTIPFPERCLAQSTFVLSPKSLVLKKTKSKKKESWHIIQPLTIEFPDLTGASWHDERGNFCPLTQLTFIIPASVQNPILLDISDLSPLPKELVDTQNKPISFPTECSTQASFTLDTPPSSKTKQLNLKLFKMYCTGLKQS